ncbi:MAG: S-layer homology domain-containing protein [Pseudanabaenaceae cyanobacterium bins.68]|nr:S-layer homology domain-containing protein [Pseudanabaenaceae cyanobacterium bins.68]
MNHPLTRSNAIALLFLFMPVVNPVIAQTQPDPVKQLLDGNFNSQQLLSRAEIATILVKAFALDRTRSLKTTPEFVDVPKTHWAYQAIKTVGAAGIMGGYEKNRFFPNQRVTRAEGFAIFANAYGVFQFPEDTVQEILSSYSDSKDLPTWARKAWATALNEKFVNLDAENRINSQKPMTRGDMAFALSRFLEREKGRTGIK